MLTHNFFWFATTLQRTNVRQPPLKQKHRRVVVHVQKGEANPGFADDDEVCGSAVAGGDGQYDAPVFRSTAFLEGPCAARGKLSGNQVTPMTTNARKRMLTQ
jgi:hypothetical protein